MTLVSAPGASPSVSDSASEAPTTSPSMLVSVACGTSGVRGRAEAAEGPRDLVVGAQRCIGSALWVWCHGCLVTMGRILPWRRLAMSADRAPAAVAAGQRRRQHKRAAKQDEPQTASKNRMNGPRLPATAAGRGREIVKRERWQQWRLVCVQAVLQRVRDAERRRQDRRAQAWADGQGAPAAQGGTVSEVIGRGCTRVAWTQTRAWSPTL